MLVFYVTRGNNRMMSIERVDSSLEDDSRMAERLGGVALTDDLTRQYLNEIGRTPLLSAEEEIVLSKRIEAGLYAAELLSRVDTTQASAEELKWLSEDGEAAKRHMLEANTRLVVSVARKQQWRNLPLLDLIQEGNIGLIRAVEKFDYTKGYKFSTYATWWIRQQIGRGATENERLIRLPFHVAEDLQKIETAQRQLSARLGRDPSTEEIADETGFNDDRVRELQDIGRSHLSLDTPLGDDSESTIQDLLADETSMNLEDSVVVNAAYSELRAVLGLLSERQQDILISRFGLTGGKTETLATIGKRWGIGAERVRQLEREAMAKLRALSDDNEGFDEHRIAALREVGPEDATKARRPAGRREQQRLDIAEQLSRYGWNLSDEDTLTLKAFVSTKTLAAAAEVLDVSKGTFDKRLRMARHALLTVSRDG